MLHYLLLLLIFALLLVLPTVLLGLASLLGFRRRPLLLLLVDLEVVQVSAGDGHLEGLHGFLEGGGRLSNLLLPALDEAVPQLAALVKVGGRLVAHGARKLEDGVDLLLGELGRAVLALGEVFLGGSVLECLAEPVQEVLRLQHVRDLPDLKM